MTARPHPSGLLIIAASLALAPGLATAQRAPDAGSVLQQIERDAPSRLPPPANTSPLQPTAPEAQPPAGITIEVRQFRFAGNTRLGDAQLQAVVAPWLNRPLDFNELRRVAQAVAQAYRDAGWVARVDLPRQDVTHGIVTIQIDEARLGKVSVTGRQPTHVSAERAIRIVEAQQPRGELLSVPAIDRGLLLLGDLPGVNATASLAAGTGPRETDVNLEVTDGARWNGGVTLDNRGARATGPNRLDANLSLNSPLGIGDQVTGNVVHTDGSDYGRIAYSVPVGYNGLRVGMNASSLRYRLVASEFSALDAHGTASSFGLDALYPIIRSTQRNLYLTAALDDKSFDNFANGATTTRYGLRNRAIGLTGNLFDNLGGGGFNTASLTLSSGSFHDKGSASARVDGSDGGFTKLRYALSRQQTLTPDTSLYAAFSGQVARSNLDSSERFYLGGAGGVRAYPSNEGGGAQGQMLNLELRHRVGNGVTVTGFYDRGRVTQYQDNSAGNGSSLSGNAPNHYSLAGYGAGVGWSPRPNLQLQATLARRTGNNPNPAANGNDQDGSLKKTRLWVAASWAF